MVIFVPWNYVQLCLYWQKTPFNADTFELTLAVATSADIDPITEKTRQHNIGPGRTPSFVILPLGRYNSVWEDDE